MQVDAFYFSFIYMKQAFELFFFFIPRKISVGLKCYIVYRILTHGLK